jgi:hypothetical protein
MSQVETVALWAGLIASIAGIVLSIAALVFGVWVNNRATQVNDQTIKSLQKIESTVERLSDDTRQLIKAAWDKMLGDFAGRGAELEASEDEDDRQIASGLREEAMAEIGANESHPEGAMQTTSELITKFEQVLKNLEQTLATQLKNAKLQGAGGRGVDILTERIAALSPSAQALLNYLSHSIHLTRRQYLKLSKSPVARDAVRELRDVGLLVPLSGTDLEGKEVPVYWLPGRTAARVRAAIQLVPSIPKEIMNTTAEELRKIDYLILC